MTMPKDRKPLSYFNTSKGKIFISYSRKDGSNIAKMVYENLIGEYDVFTDINNIQIGDVWSYTIETNISNCDVFLIILTPFALKSLEVEKEVLQAQRENKRIVPCIYRDLNKHQTRWGLENFQGIEFGDKYELIRDIHTKVDDILRGFPLV
jgi:TIR domain